MLGEFLDYRKLAVAAALVALSMSTAFAQGSIMPRPSTPSPDGGDPRNQRRAAPNFGLYEYGREIYAIKLACAECPLGDEPVNEKSARRFFWDDSLRVNLTEEEEEAVGAYLRQLFAIVQ